MASEMHKTIVELVACDPRLQQTQAQMLSNIKDEMLQTEAFTDLII